MKKVLKMLFCLMMVLSILPNNRIQALESEELLLKGNIEWVNDTDDVRPMELEVLLFANDVEVMKQIVVGPNWEYAFDIRDIPLKDTVFTIGHAGIKDYATIIEQPVITEIKTTVDDVWKKVAPNNELKIEHDSNVVVSKMTKNRGVVVWTMDELSIVEQEMITDSLEKYANGIGNPKEYQFIYGEGAKSEYGIMVTSSTISYEHPRNWSLLFVGKYNKGTITVSDSVITNTYDPTEVIPEMMTIPVQKIWDDHDNQDGIRPLETIIELYKGEQKIAELALNINNQWKGEFTNLVKYENNEEAVYSIKEPLVNGYTTKIDGYVVTNVHIPETTSVEVSKVWNDFNNQDGIRPSEIMIQVYANGIVVGNKLLNDMNQWKTSIVNLPKYDDGKLIEYAIAEIEIANYDTNIQEVSENEYVITNSYTPQKTTLQIHKVWNDNNDFDKIRPESITIQLYKNNELYGDAITLTKETDWKYAIPVALFENGQKIVWTVKESNVPNGYTVSYDGFTITNSHVAIIDTSASNSMWIWLGITMISAVGIVVLVYKKRH